MMEVTFEGGRPGILRGPIFAVVRHRVEHACCAVQDQERMLRESLKQEQRAAKAREKVGHRSCLVHGSICPFAIGSVCTICSLHCKQPS